LEKKTKADSAFADYLGGMKYKDIAEKYGVTVNTVKSWKTRYEWSRNKEKGVHTKKKKVCTQKEQENLLSYQRENDEITEVVENSELTDKQRLFCIYYVRNFNATKAYQKAYGCSYETAMVEGSKCLRKPKIELEIRSLKQNRLNREFLSEEDIFQMYMDIAFADITDYVSFGRETVEVMGTFGPVQVTNEKTGKKEILKREINTVRFKESDSIDGRLISEIKQGKDGASIKLADRMKALQWLSDHMNLATEEQKARIGVLKARAKVDDQVSVEDKVAKLFEAIGGELDAESE
jgi:phage terminase small subunit